jgi:streptogramin lyase
MLVAPGGWWAPGRAIALAAATGAVAVLLLAPASSAVATPTLTEFPLPNGGLPREVSPAPDGNVWFTEYNGNRLGFITPNGTVSELAPLTTRKSGPRGIATGADGNLWFTEVLGNKIGRVTPSGAGLVEFPLRTGNSQPYAIAAGPDGNLWFTELGVGRIGRITPTGGITEFPVPAGSGSAPRGIIGGADGNLWFCEQQTSIIGRITPGGSITEFPLSSKLAAPRYIAAGPDQALWFTEWAGNNIGRITTSGRITEFPAPQQAAQPAGPTEPVLGTGAGHPLNISVGPDGLLWWTRQGTIPHTDAVVSTTTSGLSTANLTPTQLSEPGGIKTGPDGNVWFTEEASGQIGRVSLAQTGAGYVLGIASGFTPAVRTIAVGDTVHWTFTGATTQSVTDTSGLNQFDSGLHPPTSYFDFTFSSAGTFTYGNTANPSQAGAIQVLLSASPATAADHSSLTVTWASSRLPAGLVEDVQVQRPTAPVFSTWLSGRSEPGTQFVPDAGAGVYRLQARQRNPVTGRASGWSPVLEINVPGV